MARGGKQPGAGRPSEFTEARRAETYKAAVEAFQDRAIAKLPEVVDAVLALATGVRVMVPLHAEPPKGVIGGKHYWLEDAEEVVVYRQIPDKTAALAVLEHTKGKAAQSARVETDTVIHLQHMVPRPDPVARLAEAASVTRAVQRTKKEVYANIDRERAKR